MKRALAMLGLVLLLSGPALARTTPECMTRNAGYRIAPTLCVDEELRIADYYLYQAINYGLANALGYKLEAFRTRIQEWLASRDRCCVHDPVALREFYIASLPMLRKAVIDVISQEA